jgi:hypothetical protein
VLDRRRTEYARPLAWFLPFIRTCLGGQLFFYVVVKAILVAPRRCPGWRICLCCNGRRKMRRRLRFSMLGAPIGSRRLVGEEIHRGRQTADTVDLRRNPLAARYFR